MWYCWKKILEVIWKPLKCEWWKWEHGRGGYGWKWLVMKQMKVNEQVRCMSMFEVCLYGQQKIDIKHFVAYTCTCI